MSIYKFYQQINVVGLILSASIATIFARHLLKERPRVGSGSYNAAVALTCYFIGQTTVHASLMAGWYDPKNMAFWALLVVGAFISALGALCMVRVFASAYVSSWAWVAIGAVAVVTAIVFAVF